MVFEKNSHLTLIWPNVPKNGHFGSKSQFLGLCEKTTPTNFLKCTKSWQKIVLYDRIVILSEKIRFWCQIWPIWPKWPMWPPICPMWPHNFFSKNFSSPNFHLKTNGATKFHLLKPNGAGSLFHGTLVKF